MKIPIPGKTVFILRGDPAFHSSPRTVSSPDKCPRVMDSRGRSPYCSRECLALKGWKHVLMITYRGVLAQSLLIVMHIQQGFFLLMTHFNDITLMMACLQMGYKSNYRAWRSYWLEWMGFTKSSSPVYTWHPCQNWTGTDLSSSWSLRI